MTQSPAFTLSRIILFAHRVDKLKSFYVENFNFSVAEEISDQWLVLRAGAAELAIHRIGRDYEPTDGSEFRAESNTKLVFQITGDLKSFRQKLSLNGITIGDVRSFEGISSLFCDGEDPEGNVFQLEQRLA
jgi:hypothetical protein